MSYKYYVGSPLLKKTTSNELLTSLAFQMSVLYVVS